VSASLDELLSRITGCTTCAGYLPLGPRPVLRAGGEAPVLIIGQAPGTRVHASGIPWDDPSGERLREWLGVGSAKFYDRRYFAIVPMGFCYPGRHPRGGDLPPRPECAPLWHEALLERLDSVRLTLLVGQYAQGYYLGNERKATLTETVRAWTDYGPRFLPLPHPSWRNSGWLKRNPWFGEEIVPWLRDRVRVLTA